MAVAIGACSGRSCGPWVRSAKESHPEAVRVAGLVCRDLGEDGGNGILTLQAVWEFELSSPVGCSGATAILESGGPVPLGRFRRMRTKQGREYVVSSFGVFGAVDGGELEVVVDCAQLAPELHPRAPVRGATVSAECGPQ